MTLNHISTFAHLLSNSMPFHTFYREKHDDMTTLMSCEKKSQITTFSSHKTAINLVFAHMTKSWVKSPKTGYGYRSHTDMRYPLDTHISALIWHIGEHIGSTDILSSEYLEIRRYGGDRLSQSPYRFLNTSKYVIFLGISIVFQFLKCWGFLTTGLDLKKFR